MQKEVGRALTLHQVRGGVIIGALFYQRKEGPRLGTGALSVIDEIGVCPRVWRRGQAALGLGLRQPDCM